MSGSNRTNIPKLPFYGADLLLSALALYGIYALGAIQGPWEALIAAACVAGGAWGAWLAVLPWLREHESSARLTESENLTSAVAQIQNLEQVAQTIQNANAQWQTVQDSASKTVQAAQEISLRMKRETDEFMKFLDQADEQEKSALRLEVQKARKLEDDWLQVSVRMLDHVFALYSAAARSGQTHLIHQLEQFQLACRDAARRVGLNPFAPNKNEPFDPRVHQNADQKNAVPDGAVIQDVLATGFTYQGQLLRRALVRAASPVPPSEPLQETRAHPPLPSPEPEQTLSPSASEPTSTEQIPPQSSGSTSASAETPEPFKSTASAGQSSDLEGHEFSGSDPEISAPPFASGAELEPESAAPTEEPAHSEPEPVTAEVEPAQPDFEPEPTASEEQPATRPTAQSPDLSPASAEPEPASPPQSPTEPRPPQAPKRSRQLHPQLPFE